jgi:cysteine desulfurase / selenocysteine lyase
VMIYLDNAATSWPKPPEVITAMTDVLNHAGGNPGRSGHRLSIAAARVVYEARETIANFFNLGDPLRVVFTNNATHAVNIVVHGLLKPGDSVVTSSMEHNAVMRPLRNMEKRGVKLNIVQCADDGTLNPANVADLVSSKTRLVIIVHASNVTGTISPIAEIARIVHKAGSLLLVDAAQTAGTLPVDMSILGADFIAFTGHKGLQGPPGIGGLLISSRCDTSHLESLMQGGTGSESEYEEQPGALPDKYESGTANLVGIAGLLAGIQWVEKNSVDEIRSHENKLTKLLIEGLSVIPNLRIFGTLDPNSCTSIVSFKAVGKRVSEIGFRLDEEHDIMTRVGLHCAPVAHRTIGSYPEGTVRLAPGIFTTLEDIDKTLRAINDIVSH